MQIGDTVMAKPAVSGSVETVISRAIPGEVVYIHPENRFYTVLFRMQRGMSFRESYLIHGK